MRLPPGDWPVAHCAGSAPLKFDPITGAPEGFEWPNGARLALSIVVNVEEGAEMMVRDGDPRPEPVDELGAVPKRPMRVHANESNYRYGIGFGAPRVFRLMEERGIPVTATAAALALERAPALAAHLGDHGHEAACHGYRWVFQHGMSETEEREFIRSARSSIAASVGTAPVGWLSRLLHTERTRQLLAEEGFVYHMDDYSGDLPFWDQVACADGRTRAILVMPYALDSNDMKLWTSPSLSPADWARYAIDSFDWLLEEASAAGPRMMSLGLHLRIIGRPGRIGALKRVLDHVSGRDDVWVATRKAIAAAYAAAVPPPATT